MSSRTIVHYFESVEQRERFVLLLENMNIAHNHYDTEVGLTGCASIYRDFVHIYGWVPSYLRGHRDCGPLAILATYARNKELI